MNQRKTARAVLPVSGLLIALAFSSAVWAEAMRIEVTLAGEHEVPAVETAGSGMGVIEIGEDRSVSGSVTTNNVPGTMAHIHEAAADANGPVIVPLEQSDDDTWSVPEGAQLTEAQYDSFNEGNLYINVHTEANPGGEVRDQLTP